jgi:hypothetical protein
MYVLGGNKRRVRTMMGKNYMHNKYRNNKAKTKAITIAFEFRRYIQWWHFLLVSLKCCY